MTSCGINLHSFHKAAVLAQAFFNCNLSITTLGTRGFSHVQREFSVLAKG